MWTNNTLEFSNSLVGSAHRISLSKSFNGLVHCRTSLLIG